MTSPPNVTVTWLVSRGQQGERCCPHDVRRAICSLGGLDDVSSYGWGRPRVMSTWHRRAWWAKVSAVSLIICPKSELRHWMDSDTGLRLDKVATSCVACVCVSMHLYYLSVILFVSVYAMQVWCMIWRQATLLVSLYWAVSPSLPSHSSSVFTSSIGAWRNQQALHNSQQTTQNIEQSMIS